MLFGALTTAYGTCVYYFLPLALLSFNWSMILKIFFGILIGLLLGLTLLAFNFQRLIEIGLSHLILFCDLKCFGKFQMRGIKKMVMMNLEAHRLRNQMTSLIYSMSLGFIIFLVVSYRLQLSATKLE